MDRALAPPAAGPMILTGPEILAAEGRGELVIDPFDPRQLNPNSYNYTLGPRLRVLPPGAVNDARQPTHGELVDIPPEGFVVHPGHVYLGTTSERIGSETYVTSLIGRSSMGRLGVHLQVDADLGQLGAVHQWTLEIVVCQPVRLYAAMTVGQVTFWTTTGARPRYDGHFGRFSDPIGASARSSGFADAIEGGNR